LECTTQVERIILMFSNGKVDIEVKNTGGNIDRHFPTELKRVKSTSRFWKRFSHNIPALLGLGIIFLVLAITLAAPSLAPYDPKLQFDEGLTPLGEPIGPGDLFTLGTDSLGRDILSRLLYGGQLSLFIALSVNSITLLVGTVVGMISGYFGGLVDAFLSRVVDTMLAFPGILSALAISTILKPGVGVVILILSLTGWTGITRLVRGQVLSLREREFILAARAVGVKNRSILLRHIVPHLISPLIIVFTLSIPGIILGEAVLSYLGAGVPPDVPSWGNLIQDGSHYYRSAPWILLFPGMAIFLTVLGFTLIGEGFKDASNPYSKYSK